jgi:hypothetical protein
MFAGQHLASGACDFKCKVDVEAFYTGTGPMDPGDYYAILDDGEPTGTCTRIWRTSSPNDDFATTTGVQKKYRKYTGAQCSRECYSNGGVHGVAGCNEGGTLEGPEENITCYTGCTDDPPEDP